MKVSICGVRGSVPITGPDFMRAGGDTSCVAISPDGEPPTLILDAGTGVRRVTELLEGAPFRGALVLTHLHWDHVQGLPFFLAGDRPDAEVALLLPDQGPPAIDVLSRVMSPPFFPILPDDLRGGWSFDGYDEGARRVDGFEVLAAEVPHGGGRTMGLRVSDGRASVAYIPDHGPQELGPGDDGLGPLHDAVVELVAGADLLIHDAQYTAAELPAHAHFGHAAADYAVELAARCGVPRVLLFHHDPCRTDDQLDAIVAGLSVPAGITVSVAREGETIHL